MTLRMATMRWAEKDRTDESISHRGDYFRGSRTAIILIAYCGSVTGSLRTSRMTRGLFFLTTVLMASAWAQEPAATPKKDPFAGFGNTSLDRRPGGPSTPSPFVRPASPTPRSAATVPAPDSGDTGITLNKDWTGHQTESSGGQTRKLEDLRALISGYGEAEADLAEHPEVTVYEGPVFGGGQGQTCRITYLMPLNRAEQLLLGSTGISTISRAVAPGLPDGLFLHTYDARAGIYNHVCIVTDNHKPQQQVVCLLLKAEGVNWIPGLPWVQLNRDWDTFDYVNTQNRGRPGIIIDTRVLDQRQQGGYIVVNTTGAPNRHPPPLLAKPAKWSPKEDSTWYVPVPLVKLMLYCLSHTMGSESSPSATPPR